MGPVTGSRTIDNIDRLVLLIVLLLRVSPLVLALARFCLKLASYIYGYSFRRDRKKLNSRVKVGRSEILAKLS